MNRRIAPMRAAIRREGVIVSFSFVAGGEPSGHSITYERKPKSQGLANLHLKDRRALFCLAATGDDVFPAVLLDRQGFAGENFMAGIVPSRAHRMGSVDDPVPGGGMASGALPIRPRATVLGPASASASVSGRGDRVPRNSNAPHATFGRRRVLQCSKQRRQRRLRRGRAGADFRLANRRSVCSAAAGRALCKIGEDWTGCSGGG